MKMQKIQCRHHIQILLQTQEHSNKISSSFSKLFTQLHLHLRLKQPSRNHHVRCRPALSMSHIQKTLQPLHPDLNLHQQREHPSCA